MLLRQSPSGPVVSLPSLPGEQANTNVGAAASIDWSKGPAQSLLITQNCNVTSVSLPAGQSTWVQLKVVQGAGGGFVPTFVGAKTPGGVPLTFSAAPGAIDIVSLYWDGLTLYATTAGLAFA